MQLEERFLKTSRNDLRIRFASLTTIAAIALFVAVSIALTMTPGASAASHDVSISNFAFSPNSITIAPGDTVTWTNSDGTTHTVTGSNESWGSGNMANGQTYTHQFNETGDFTYHCAIHPSMTGVVHVTSDGGTPQQPHSPGLSSSALIAIIAAVAVVAAVSIVVLWRRMRSKKA
jgi:plastocyanin